MVGDTAKETIFACQQEAVRKAVERVLAFLFSRFSIIYQPSGLLDKGNMEDMMISRCILQKMIVEAHKNGYSGTKNAQVTGLREYLGQVSDVNIITEPEEVRENSLFRMARLSEEKSPILYRELKEALASAMWEEKGRESE
jgi:hypothetical protein